MEEGKPYSLALVSECRNQLGSVQAGRQRIEELLRVLWNPKE